ncbi:leucine-rich repeat extensin-like protein 1 [Pyrus x bretschneideri]|uniref:leucine-rich repeat extensin-like protein 1 n=1 Tax=Pyrus x bretschneideri TaxID=225117 RepID=UPI00202E0A90|nr:leucine-rich repeat extensin-like protein 1 [Pyrus x bretschneideri]
MASSRPPPQKPLDLDLTIVSAKHLKNVNWKNGDLKPYAVFWVDPDRRLATKSDDSGSTRPVWNERFTVPLTLSLHDSFLTLEIFHSKPSDTPKPLVGTLRVPLKDLPDQDDSTRIRTFQLVRPSGRPQGKIRVKLAVRERPLPPDYHISPPPSYFYGGASMPPPPVRDFRSYSPSPYSSTLPASAPSPSASPPPYHYSSYSDPYSGYYPAYYSSAPPPPPRPFFDRPVNYGGPSGPSAPLDYSNYDQNQKPKSGKMGLGTGLAVGAVAGGLGAVALDEGLRYEEDKVAQRVENDLRERDDYSNYRADY